MAEGIVKGIQAIDCSIYPRWPGMEKGPHDPSKMGPLLFRDPDSRTYLHPAQHHFGDSTARIERGDTPESTIEMMDAFGVETALLLVDSQDPKPALDVMARHPRRFFGKLYVRPMEGVEAVRKIDAIARGNPLIKGLHVSPYGVGRPPNDTIYYPIYVKAIELDLPIAMNVGIPGPRLPGEVSNPLYLDEPLWFFPELKIVMIHGGEPWETTCVKLMLKWPNLYYMTSAFSPRHYPKEIVHYANTRGADKVLFAGFYPGLSYERVQAELRDLKLRDHVWPKFLRENAARVFKLGERV